jgi:nucleotide-binding universal stress UspA family protein
MMPTAKPPDMHHYQDILVGTDGSDTAARAVEHAVSLADGVDDTVYVLSVADAAKNPLMYDVETLDGVEAAVERTATEMQDHAGEATVRGAVREGPPADGLLSYADEQDVDVIVLGRQGRSGLADEVPGSTADRVVRNADVPVAVVPEAAEA